MPATLLPTTAEAYLKRIAELRIENMRLKGEEVFTTPQTLVDEELANVQHHATDSTPVLGTYIGILLCPPESSPQKKGGAKK